MKKIITFMFILVLLIIAIANNSENIVNADDNSSVNYLRFTLKEVPENSETATLIFFKDGVVDSLDTKKLYYKIVSPNNPNGDWTEVILENNGECHIDNLRVNDYVLFKRGGEGTYSFSTSNTNCYTFRNSEGSSFEVSGDVTTLINGSGNVLDLTENPNVDLSYCFDNLFETSNFKFNNLVLPSTTLAPYCYQYMFYRCEQMESTPVLPATNLAEGCYSNMFFGCTSLITPPELPATALAVSCYDSMFSYCENLATAPVLPAMTLAESCYEGMFDDCTNLIVPPALPATTLADSCYANMFYFCENLETAPELPATTLADYCYDMMFADCTNLIVPPELPAMVLAESCYAGMFDGCENLEIAPELPATTLADHCYDMMFVDCTSLRIPPELPATLLPIHCYYYMFAGSGINIDEEQSGTNAISYRFPSREGEVSLIIGEDEQSPLTCMFASQSPYLNGISDDGTPDLNGTPITLYLDSTQVTISFDNDGVSLGSYQVDPLSIINFPSVSRSGYTLKGWSLRPDGKDSLYLVGTPVKARGNMKFYAIWEEVQSSSSSDDSNRHVVLNTSACE